MTLPFRPIQDVVVFEKPKAEELRPSGVIVPAMFDDQEEGTVLAVGPGKWKSATERHPMSVKPGDRVLVNKHQVQEFELRGCKYLVVREEHLRAVL